MNYFQRLIYALVAAILVPNYAYAFDSADEPPTLESVNRCDEKGRVRAEYLNWPLTLPEVISGECLTGTKLPIDTLKSAYELRLFAFDLGKCDYFARFDPDSESLMPPKGAALDNAVRGKIESMVPPVVWEEGASMCFEPHHALVWLDKQGNTIATANVCFTCAAVEISFAKRTGVIQFSANFADLKKMFRRVGAPINLREACSNPAHPAWKSEIDALCELKSLRSHTRRLASPELRKRWHEAGFPGCVQLPGTIRF